MSKTIEKGLRLLDLFTEERPYLRLNDIHKLTDMPKPTLLRILSSFEELGYLQRVAIQENGLVSDSKTYSLGLKFLEMAQRVESRFEIRSIAYPYMKELQEKYNEAVQLVVVNQDTGVYIEKVESTRPVRLYTRVGRQAPLYAGACTRTLLAFLNQEAQERILSGEFIKFANGTLESRQAIEEQLKLTIERGYSYSDSELEEGTASLAVPIFNRFGEVMYSISIASFSSTLTRERVDEYIDSLWEAAASISKQLGYKERYPYSN
ncbi:IclR family transcriptional regulator [Chryseomicrobium palamuruense]|uniref:IclR family transcriptional regulator n=1 Tax=Chryseomicrobium palamuruense TaxID=682973 RepID=A0ABV8USN3_9BACL